MRIGDIKAIFEVFSGDYKEVRRFNDKVEPVLRILTSKPRGFTSFYVPHIKVFIPESIPESIYDGHNQINFFNVWELLCRLTK